MPYNKTRRNKSNRNKSNRNRTEGGASCMAKNESMPAPLMGGKRNKTRRNKTEGGASCMAKNESMPAPLMGGKRNKTRRNKTEGGKRKKGPSEWNKKVMRVYSEMKNTDSNASFRDALVEASKRKKAGTL
jgi:hypothetical protein